MAGRDSWRRVRDCEDIARRHSAALCRHQRPPRHDPTYCPTSVCIVQSVNVQNSLQSIWACNFSFVVQQGLCYSMPQHRSASQMLPNVHVVRWSNLPASFAELSVHDRQSRHKGDIGHFLPQAYIQHSFTIYLSKKPIIINASDALARGRWRLPKAGTRQPICRSTYCDYVYTQGDVTSRKLWSRYDRHFVGRPITCMTHNVMRDVNGRRFTVLFEQN